MEEEKIEKEPITGNEPKQEEIEVEKKEKEEEEK